MVVHNPREIKIGHLYADQMNVYGDMGNILALKYRLKKRGVKTSYLKLNSLGDIIKNPVDILIGGGGQDSNQGDITEDLLKYAAELRSQCKDGLTGMMVCGMYQLFGHYFTTHSGQRIEGVGVLDLYTEGGADRMIGNVKVHSRYGTLVGFENHSGNTHLAPGQSALGEVYQGYGNNNSNQDSTEGACVDNIFGTYLHGPVLPKNPRLTDDLILRALNRKYGTSKLSSLDDDLEHKTAEHIRQLKY